MITKSYIVAGCGVMSESSGAVHLDGPELKCKVEKGPPWQPGVRRLKWGPFGRG